MTFFIGFLYMDSEVHLVVPYSIRESIIVTTTSIKYVVKAVVCGPADLLFILTVYRVSSKTVYTWFLPFFSSKFNAILTSWVSFEN